MSEIAVTQMRSRMLKETEGFLSKKLTFNPSYRKSIHKEFLEYFRRFALRQGQLIDTETIQELSP